MVIYHHIFVREVRVHYNAMAPKAVLKSLLFDNFPTHDYLPIWIFTF